MALPTFNQDSEPVTNLTPSASQQNLMNLRWDNPVDVLSLKEK